MFAHSWEGHYDAQLPKTQAPALSERRHSARPVLTKRELFGIVKAQETSSSCSKIDVGVHHASEGWNVSTETEELDFGLRSNDSCFAGLDETPAGNDTARKALSANAASPAVAVALPFRVAIVESEEDLLRVQQLRQAAYGHHLPALAAHFGKSDPVDRWPDVTVFYAEDKASGRVVGSARLQCNRARPLQIEQSITLPEILRGRLLAEITRMTVISGYPQPVKLALVKAIHLYCVALQISGIVCASRPSLMRQYLNLGFEDLYGDDRLVPMAHGSNLDHRVLFRDPVTSEAHHRARRHPDYDFVFRAYHPDIEVFNRVARAADALRIAGDAPRYSRAA